MNISLKIIMSMKNNKENKPHIKKRSLTIFMVYIFCVLPMSARTPAFPGAEGGGMFTTGGRGGTVYYVNSLADTNTGDINTREGTLRWCVNRSGKRIILFKVSGIISLTSKLGINNGNVTIAGQSAPGDGICIRDCDVSVDADNVIIRYLRFRHGDRISTQESDAIWGRYRQNIIIDHCSMSWSVDECASFYSNCNFTMQWCILAESLKNSIHAKGAHGYCGLWGGKNATFHHNLMVHHDSRNPRFNGWKRSGLDYVNPMDEERMDFRNNVIYNWGSKTGYGGEALGKYNVVNNYYKAGPGTANSKDKIVQVDLGDTKLYPPEYGRFYLEGNVLYGNSSVTENNKNGVRNNTGAPLDSCVTTTPFDCFPISQHTADKAFENVLKYAGASLERDTVDKRVTHEAFSGTCTYKGSISKIPGIIDTPDDVGGWPEYKSGIAQNDTDIDGIPDGWLDSNYPGKLANDTTQEGYTYLEVYLNGIVSNITEGQNKESVISSLKETAGSARNATAYYDKTACVLQIIAPENIKRVQLFSIDGKLTKDMFTFDKKSLKTELSGTKDGIYLVRLSYSDGDFGMVKVFVKN